MARNQDRVEFNLEGRQIAGVVAGALVTLALVFALGVGFGRQLALAPAPNAPQADLAHLDARPATPAVQDTGFTFHEALVKGDQTVVAARPPPVPTPVPAPVPAVPVPEAKPETVAAMAPAAAPEVKTADAKVEKPALVAAEAPKKEEKAAEPAPAPKAEEKPAPVAAKAEEKAAPKKEEPATWCVQFGASPARAEADKLAATLLDYGYTSYVVVADLPGKGRFYRVRVGHFAAKDQADKLRADATAKHKLSGVVMPAR